MPSQVAGSYLHSVNYKYTPNSKRVMQQMNGGQMRVLKSEFAKNQIWSKSKLKQLSNQLSLSKSKLYKWNWHQK